MNEALSNLGCNSVTQSSSVTDPGATLAEVTRQIRIWRPAVLIGPDANQGSELDKRIATAIDAVANQATTDDRFTHLTEQLALPPWQLSRVFAIAALDSRGTHRVEYTAAVPQSGQTLAEVATVAKSLFAYDYAPCLKPTSFK